MKTFFSLSLMIFSLSSFANQECPLFFSNAGFCAEIEWLGDGPVLNEVSEFKVSFWKSSDPSRTNTTPPALVHMKTWMIMDNGHNHGGPSITWNEVESGVYEVLDARFFMMGMAGCWQIIVSLADEQAAFDVEF